MKIYFETANYSYTLESLHLRTELRSEAEIGIMVCDLESLTGFKVLALTEMQEEKETLIYRNDSQDFPPDSDKVVFCFFQVNQLDEDNPLESLNLQTVLTFPQKGFDKTVWLNILQKYFLSRSGVGITSIRLLQQHEFEPFQDGWDGGNSPFFKQSSPRLAEKKLARQRQEQEKPGSTVLKKVIQLAREAMACVWEEAFEKDLFSDAKSSVYSVKCFLESPDALPIGPKWLPVLQELGKMAFSQVCYHPEGNRMRAQSSHATLGRLIAKAEEIYAQHSLP